MGIPVGSRSWSANCRVADTATLVHCLNGDLEIHETYNAYEPLAPNRPTARYLGQAVTYACNEYAKTFSNFLLYGTQAHRVHYLKAKWNMNRTQAKRVSLLFETRVADLLQHGNNNQQSDEFIRLLLFSRFVNGGTEGTRVVPGPIPLYLGVKRYA